MKTIPEINYRLRMEKPIKVHNLMNQLNRWVATSLIELENLKRLEKVYKNNEKFGAWK